MKHSGREKVVRFFEQIGRKLQNQHSGFTRQGIGKIRCPSDWIVYGGYVILAYTQGNLDNVAAAAWTVEIIYFLFCNSFSFSCADL